MAPPDLLCRVATGWCRQRATQVIRVAHIVKMGGENPGLCRYQA
jgi:hypothetical protein